MAPDAATTSYLVVGEALVDVIVGESGAAEHAGGSPANVAFGLARLGDRVTLLTQLGADARGAMITRHLESAGVEVLATGADLPTSTATATIGTDGSASYDFDVTWDVDIADAPTADVVHVGSIGALATPGADEVRLLVTVRRASSLITFDPNIRPALLGDHAWVVARVEHLVVLSDIVKVSSDDLEWLYPASTPVASAMRWSTIGGPLIALTNGGAGVTAFWHGARIDLPGWPVAVIDTIGAGDTFMAALLDALGRTLPALERELFGGLATEAVTDALQWAVAAAAMTVSRPGADLPTRAEVDALLRSAKVGRRPPLR
jgi:fructokinase